VRSTLDWSQSKIVLVIFIFTFYYYYNCDNSHSVSSELLENVQVPNDAQSRKLPSQQILDVCRLSLSSFVKPTNLYTVTPHKAWSFAE